MKALFIHAWRGISRNLGRTVLYLVGLALAVGLFADTLFFVDVSSRDMTANTLAPVQVDFIARATTPDLKIGSLESALKNQNLVQSAVPVSSADFSWLQKTGSNLKSAAGKVFALPENYYSSFGFLPISTGKFDSTGALVGDATATQLGLKVGDRLELTFAAGIKQPYKVNISGIVAMGTSEPLFYNPTSGEAFGVVSDVVFLPPALFEHDLAAILEKLPITTSSVGQTGSNIVLLPVERQVHLKINRSSLNPDPAKSLKQLDALRRNLERPFPGQVRVQDNLGAKLLNAKKDILAAKMLFLFLSLPGVLLAGYLARYATELSGEQVRRETAWLRVRGAGTREILVMTGFTALLVAILGSSLGLILGIAALVFTLGINSLQIGNLSLILSSAGYAVLAGFILTGLAFFLPVWAQLRHQTERKSMPRNPPVPLWRRMNLDGLALIASGIVLYITAANGGFKPTGTEGTAVTLSFYLFLAPFLFWVGTTLLVARFADLLLSKGTRFISSSLQAIIGDFGAVAASSLERRRDVAGVAITLTALSIGFGVALTLFIGTYTVQKHGDIQYVVGSDVRVTPAANAELTPDFTQKLEAVMGVQASTAIARDAVALIGSEKKSVYGIDVPSFLKTAYLPDAMFENGSAVKTLEALRSRPNGVLLARDQADKYDIKVGDSVLMRLYNPKTAQYTQLTSQAVGIYTYLSTSSQDSDFILNRDFMTKTSGTNGADLFLVKTSSSNPNSVTSAIQNQLGQSMTLKIVDTITATKIDESSLTSLNLVGLGNLERLYTTLIIASSFIIFLLSMLETRRKEFGIMRALGSNEMQLRALIGAETLTISSLSLLAGVSAGAVVAALFVMLLQVIFLIPPSGVIYPWLDLAGLFGLALLGVVLGVLAANRKLSSLRVAEVLREA